MRRAVVYSGLLIALVTFAGCSRKLEQTVATQVYSPPDRAASVSSAEPEQSKSAAQQRVAEKPVEKRKFKTTKSGVKYYDLKIGHGEQAQPNCRLTVHYKGWLDDGTVFDSSRTRDEPFTFTLGVGEVIRGWDEGIRGMRVGGVRELIIPPSLGYGNKASGRIPPNSTLHFQVELLAVSR